MCSVTSVFLSRSFIWNELGFDAVALAMKTYKGDLVDCTQFIQNSVSRESKARLV